MTHASSGRRSHVHIAGARQPARGLRAARRPVRPRTPPAPAFDARPRPRQHPGVVRLAGLRSARGHDRAAVLPRPVAVERHTEHAADLRRRLRRPADRRDPARRHRGQGGPQEHHALVGGAHGGHHAGDRRDAGRRHDRGCRADHPAGLPPVAGPLDRRRGAAVDGVRRRGHARGTGAARPPGSSAPSSTSASCSPRC